MKNKTPDDLDNAVAKKLNMYACLYACVKMPERESRGLGMKFNHCIGVCILSM